jgi:disulfide bond formation protein DsbB
MDFMRIVLGLLIAATGFIAVLAVLIAFTGLSFPGPLERVGAVLLLVLIETTIGFGTYHAFGKVMGSTAPYDDCR